MSRDSEVCADNDAVLAKSEANRLAMESAFSRGKKRSLDKLDLSKKGCIDEDIDHIVCFLNGCESYFTTSSCSGRITLIDGAPESTGVQKQNCVWLFVSHQQCTSDDLISALAKSSGDAVLKFEPFVLHIQCRRLEDAQLMHSVAVNSGFRNSGLTVSKAGRIITAVRSTHGLEVPLSHQGRLLVGPEYIHFLVQVANQKMEENLRRIQRFYQNLQSALCAEQLQKLQIPDTQSSQELQNQDTLQSLAAEDGEEERRVKSVYKRRRKRGQQHQTDSCHGGTDSSALELDDCLDLLTSGEL